MVKLQHQGEIRQNNKQGHGETSASGGERQNNKQAVSLRVFSIYFLNFSSENIFLQYNILSVYIKIKCILL